MRNEVVSVSFLKAVVSLKLSNVSSSLLLVSVGFEYESCPDLILWEKRTAVLQGYETIASNLGGWSVDKHHALNIQSGELVHRKILKCSQKCSFFHSGNAHKCSLLA